MRDFYPVALAQYQRLTDQQTDRTPNALHVAPLC